MRGHIPAETTSFVGREQELASLRAALGRHRLVTLTGAGGVGKSRLAQRAAAGLGHAAAAREHAAYGGTGAAGGTGAPDVPDGVWWADLSTLDGPDLLLATVSDAVDLADHSPRMRVEVLGEWLADKRLLLVLDSCEHLVGECADLLAALFAAAPGLTVLATSRRPLAFPGEKLMEVLPLAPGGPQALALFQERVAGGAGRGRLSEPGAAEAAASVCRRLEGVPLAIELAAAQVGPASVAEVDRRLGAPLDVLSRPGFVWPRRHQALRTAIGWSHELCTPVERLLWARLSVFRGDFDLDAARAVAAGGALREADVRPALEGLVDQCVVGRTATGGAERYGMLDTIREYGRSWLAELGEEDAAARRHADHHRSLVRRAEAGWSGSGQLAGYRAIEQVHADLCAALDHLLVHDPAAAAELAGGLVYYWACCGHLKQARTYLERTLRAHASPDRSRTRALIGLGATLTLQGEYEAAAGIDAEVRAAGAAGDPQEQTAVACLTGLLAMLTGRPADALRTVRQAMGAAEPGPGLGSPDQLRCTLIEVLSLTALGHFDEGRTRALELRERCAGSGEIWTRTYLDYQLSVVALLSARPDEAAEYARTMLAGKRQLGDAFGVALGLDLLAAALAADGRAEQAAFVYGAGGAYWRRVGHPQRGAPELRPIRRQCEQSARAALGDAAYSAAFADGATAHGPTALRSVLLPDDPTVT